MAPLITDTSPLPSSQQKKGVFALLLLLAGYAGLSPQDDSSSPPAVPINDKALHALASFALTLAFYWVVDTTRRRTLHLTLAVCTLGLGAGSELLQALLPNGRDFDLLDVAANVAGSLAALALCSWYHRRMLERRRLRKYAAVPTAADAEGGAGDEDLELGEGPGIGGGHQHEEGVTVAAAAGSSAADAPRATTLEEEVDNWDENAVDAWDEDDLGDVGGGSGPAPGKETDASGDAGKKRSD